MDTVYIKFPGYHEFETWLKTKAPNEIVGLPGESCDCPLSRFSGYKIGLSTFGPKDQTRQPCWYLPAWAVRFANDVDIDTIACGQEFVTAEFALNVLARCI